MEKLNRKDKKEEKTWHIVQFMDDTIEAIPAIWLKDDGNIALWPPWEEEKKLEKALHSYMIPDATWEKHSIKKIFWNAGSTSYEVAKIKVSIGEEHSDIESYYQDLTNKNLRKIRSKKLMSSTEDEKINYSKKKVSKEVIAQPEQVLLEQAKPKTVSPAFMSNSKPIIKSIISLNKYKENEKISDTDGESMERIIEDDGWSLFSENDNDDQLSKTLDSKNKELISSNQLLNKKNDEELYFPKASQSVLKSNYIHKNLNNKTNRKAGIIKNNSSSPRASSSKNNNDDQLSKTLDSKKELISSDHLSNTKNDEELYLQKASQSVLKSSISKTSRKNEKIKNNSLPRASSSKNEIFRNYWRQQ